MLAVSSAASRHLLRQQPTSGAVVAAHLRRAGGGNNDRAASARRHFGLRRTQTKGRRGPAIPRLLSQQQTSSSTTSGGTTATPPPSASSSAAAQQQQHFRATDPHAIANEMVASSSSKRTPGTESVASLTNEQKLSNYAMAGGLLAFVSYVFYYSLASVGGENKARSLLFGEEKSEGDANVTLGFEDFLKEANEERTLEEKRAKEERRARGDARELVELEESTAARLRSEGLGEDVVASAGSASEEEEREMARIAGFVDGGDSTDGGGGDMVARRPLWKRVVFFWRRE